MIASDTLMAYEALVATVKGVERKGATMPYTSVQGNMFSFLDKDGRLGLRLPEKEREAFLLKFKTKLCEAHGAVLKEYVLVPDAMLTGKVLPSYFKASYNYAKSLKPKGKAKVARKKK